MNVVDDVTPGFAAVARHLEVPVVRAGPDDLIILRRFGNRIDRGVHLGGGVIDRHAAGLFLLLFLRIVGRKIR